MRNDCNLKLINFFAFLSSAWFFIPVLLPYCKDEIGVGYQGMLMSEAAFAASCVIFDVPTGWISDVWRRKHALSLGALLNFSALVVLLYATNIWLLFVSQILFGIGISLFNGTHTALLYDTLLSLGRENEYRQREGKRQALGLYGTAIAAVLGGFAYTHNHFLPILLTMTAYGIVFILTCAMAEPPRYKFPERRHPVSDILDTFTYILHGHGDVGLVILLAALLFCATRTIMWSQQAYFMALGIPVSFYGILMAIGWLLGGFSSHAAHFWDGKINNFRALVTALSAAVIICLCAGAYLGYSGIVFLMMGGSCIFGTISPRVNEIINQNVDSSRRATLLSSQTFLTSLLFVPVSSTVGWITDRWSIQPALLSISLWLALSMLLLLIWKRRHARVVLKW